MLLLRYIAFGLFCLCFALPAFAEVGLRPFARSDAVELRLAAEEARLGALRVAARPAHMIRYPEQIETKAPDLRPMAREAYHPRARWDHKTGGELWTRAAMTAVASFGSGLHTLVPRDIGKWCPAYETNTAHLRQSFWAGMMSALAKHESTYNPRAVGGGDLWYGLLQIYPDTAQRYGCRATTGEALKDPTENLSCAARIMNVTVARDNAIAIRDSRWRGVAADWGPMTKPSKIAEMSAWTRAQDYCVMREDLRPRVRPSGFLERAIGFQNEG